MHRNVTFGTSIPPTEVVIQDVNMPGHLLYTGQLGDLVGRWEEKRHRRVSTAGLKKAGGWQGPTVKSVPPRIASVLL